MEYYIIKDKSIDLEQKSSGLVADIPSANGQYVPDFQEYFDKIGNGEILFDTPVFDYFHLQSFGPKEEWEWRLQDIHGGMGEYPRGAYWYISDDFKNLLENFKIAPKYHFYETRLLYKGKKLKYWIFQFPIESLDNIEFKESKFFYKENNNTEIIYIDSKEMFLSKRRELLLNHDVDLQCSKVCFLQTYDIVYNLLCSDTIVSERLKNAIETMELRGFEFSELDYEVVITS